MRRNFSSALFTGLLAVAVVAAPGEADAQGFISPFIGFDFGGDSGCPSIGDIDIVPDCEDKTSNIGVAFGTLGNVAGFEAELGYARGFFGDPAEGSSNLLSFMANLILGPRIGPVRPYLVGGVGLIKTHTDFEGISLLETNNNNFGWDFGGGVMIMFGDHIGVRGDLRRFATFQETVLGFTLSDEKLSFQRAAAALVLAF